jgi:hypothetical protein
MGGNGRHRPHAPEQDNDPYAKLKFSIPSFYGSYDAETYLDWKMTVEQKFSSHLVPERHRVRQATSEFKDFAIISWNELVNARYAPQTWTALKEEMRARFVPPSYRHDLRKKLQRFDQGDTSVQEYYQEFPKGMLRCGVVEDQEDQIVRFYGGLRHEIQDIVDYKEYHSMQRLFQLAMLVEKELQGHQQQQRNNTFMPRQLSTPAKAAPSSSVRTATPSSTGVVRRTAPSTSKGQDNSKSQTPPGVAAKANTSTGRTSNIKCHRCRGFGHMQRDFPSKRTIIATADGGYASASDIEDENIIAANISGSDDGAEEVLGTSATNNYRTLIVLLPMTPTEIVQFENEKKNNAKQKGVFNSKNQQPIKLNSLVLFATKSDLVELSASTGPCYALVCKHALYSIEVASIALPPAVANLLQEYMDVFPSELPPGLPPMQGIEHRIDLIPGASLPNRAAYRTNPTRLRKFSNKSRTFWAAGTFVRALVLVLFLFFWFLRKMALGTCVLIVEPSITLPFDIAILFLVWMTCLMS